MAADLISTYGRVLRLHRKRVQIVILLLLLDGTLDTRLAAIFYGDGEGDGNSSNDAVNHGCARLALNS